MRLRAGLNDETRRILHRLVIWEAARFATETREWNTCRSLARRGLVVRISRHERTGWAWFEATPAGADVILRSAAPPPSPKRDRKPRHRPVISRREWFEDIDGKEAL